jgi:hypothetical protein
VKNRDIPGTCRTFIPTVWSQRGARISVSCNIWHALDVVDKSLMVSRDAQRPLSEARNPISALTIHKTVFRHRDETPPMVKTKPSSLAAAAAKIPRKSNADHAAVATEAPVMTSPELTNGHEGLVTPPRPFSTVTTPIVLNPEDNDRTSTPPASYTTPAGSATNPFITPTKTDEELWASCLANRNTAASAKVPPCKSDVGVLQSAGLKLRMPGDLSDKIPAVANPPATNDADILFLKWKLHNRIMLLYRFRSRNPARQPFPDFKMFKMLQRYKEAKAHQSQVSANKPDEDVNWMEQIWLDEKYRLWYVDQKPVPSQASTYATRLYTMTWLGEDVSDAQVMLLAKMICENVNAYRVDPTAISTRPEAQARIVDENDPSSLFWLPSCTGVTVVGNEFLSNAACLDILGNPVGNQFGNEFFEKNKDLVGRFFVPGTMDLTTSLRIAAPFSWLTEAAKSEWRLLNGFTGNDEQEKTGTLAE